MLDDLERRGLLANVTDRVGLTELLAKQSVSLYAGYDPTSPSLHVGSLVPTVLLRRFQAAGHRPIVVVGGATGMIGDPSGKSDERNMLDEATLAANLAGIRGQLERLLPHGNVVVTDNYDWTKGVSYLEFLRKIGKFITVNYMTAKDSVKSRLESESGLSYTEFSYMLLQAYDFVELNRQYDCRLQVGGSDQYGNITAGCELSRKLGGAQLYGMVAPLLLDSTGQKMGKTSTGERIWLDPQRTTAYAFYQYWLNQPDADAPKFLKMFSMDPIDDIEALLVEHDKDRGKRSAQRALAIAMTKWVHGDDGLARAERATQIMFGGDLAGVTDRDLDEVAGSIPSIDVPRTELAAGIDIVELFSRTPLATSKGEARRLIEKNNGATVGNTKITDGKTLITLSHRSTDTRVVLRKGKREYCLVRVV